MRRKLVLAGLASMLLVAGLTGCRSTAPSTSPTTQSSPSAAKPLLVFAAASLRPTFDTIAARFKAENPGATVDITYAGSSELATQLTQGASADVFASADTAQMDKVATAGLLAGKPVNFASNTLVIVTARAIPSRSSRSPISPSRGSTWWYASSRCPAAPPPCASRTPPACISTRPARNPTSPTSSTRSPAVRPTPGWFTSPTRSTPARR
ncbi:molybdate ABC transporter, periplasmic molybdate-binding protein [Mycobacterium xenopi 4042]|uniref:Molybdate ABC transporter, periplasmic molybdate-binding protein n=1 Tax=Mycobacterium xenopi 4042 TaxID=1299334 RepID=X8BGF8_MYCXE|nr:molybdate ABC transporter, periplasmic molybdate-binding protein [Mycobacterium xenopi 4042]